MVLPFSYCYKLAGTAFLASFCLWFHGMAQLLNVRYESGDLVMVIDHENIKLSLENGTLAPSKVMKVFLKNPDQYGLQPAILGDYSYNQDTLRFTPILYFSPGRTYFVRYRDQEVYQVVIPFKASEPPKVLAIYPSADTLPANQLKFYIHFTKPMSEGTVYKLVKLVRNETDTLNDPFVRLEPALWNREKTRLTLWLDPGRIKRDLNPNREFGAPLQAGSQYQLIVSSSWQDQQGVALQSPFVKKFLVGADDRKKPKVADWKVIAPPAGSKDPLSIDFGEPMDHALAGRVIEVLDEKQELCTGAVYFQKKDQVCRFVPDRSWRPGYYQLRIGSELEDLAGNNLNRLFDVDLQKKGEQLMEEQFYWVGFWVKD